MAAVRGGQHGAKTGGDPGPAEATPAVGPPATTLMPEDSICLFEVWRAVLMGNVDGRASLSRAVAGYFFAEPVTPGAPPAPIPLHQVRRSIIDVVNDADLTDAERSVLVLHYGLRGLPLPYSSRLQPDIAAGRNESSPRETRTTALAKVARTMTPRPRRDAPARRPPIDPLRQPWFTDLRLSKGQRGRLVSRSFVRAMSGCDGPYAVPTIAGLNRWYRDCGFADQDLLPTTTPTRSRPNGNALARAAAVMEIALGEEVAALETRRLRRVVDPPIPTPERPRPGSLTETVTHPDLVRLVNGDLSPESLLAAAETLKDKALSGEDVRGQMALFKRCARPRLAGLPPPTLERVCAGVSYVAAIEGDPFLALEWLGYVIDGAGITDRTFTLLVNGAEAASSSGRHGLAVRIDHLSVQLQKEWRIPADQDPTVERVEAEQQRLVANAFSLEQLGLRQQLDGDATRAEESLRGSVELACRSAGMALRVLVDDKRFPDRQRADKAGRHGGDLTWPWLLAAVVRMVEPLDQLATMSVEGGARDPDRKRVLRGTATLAQQMLDACPSDLERPYYRDWYRTARHLSASILAASS